MANFCRDVYHYERWRHLIQAAQDDEAVAQVIRDYAHSLLPSDIALMPPKVHEVLARPDADIPSHALELVRLELAFVGDEEATSVLHQITTTFIAASNRLCQIHQRFKAP